MMRTDGVGQLFVAAALALPGMMSCESAPEMPGDEETRQYVAASKGATLELSDGERVVVPPGALAEDAEVTLSRSQCSGLTSVDGFGGCIYRLETDGTLVERVELELPSHTGARPTCVLAKSERGWRCLGDSTGEGMRALGSASQLTAFTTRTERSATELQDDTCTDWPFEHCGGNIAGTWEMVHACGSYEQITGISSTAPDPFASCPDDEVYRAHPFTVSTTLEFRKQAGEPGSGGWAFSYRGSVRVFEHEVVTESCLSSVGRDCHDDCVSEYGVCQCVWLDTAGDSAAGGTWTIDENHDVYLDGSSEPLRYCITGDQLVMQRRHPDGDFIEVYTRR